MEEERESEIMRGRGWGERWRRGFRRGEGVGERRRTGGGEG